MSQVEKLRQSLHWLDSNLHRLSFKQVKEALSNFLPRVPFLVQNFDNTPFYFRQREYSGMNVVYRARPIYDAGNRPHMTVEDISYIPRHLLDEWPKEFGRANKPHESMFYGAFNPSTAAIEVLHSNADFMRTKNIMLTVGIWKFNQPLVLTEVPLSQKRHDSLYLDLKDTPGFKAKFDAGYFDDYQQHIDGFGLDPLERITLDYFSDKFCEFNEHNLQYLVSNYYADRVFGRYPEHPFDPGEGPTDGILYPSIANAYQDVNIALPPDIVDSKLTFIGAMQMWALGGDNKFNCNQIDKARADEQGNLIWERYGNGQR